MFKRFPSLVATIFASCAAAEGYDTDHVKMECSQKWGGRYDMVQYCIQKREDGLKTYTTLKIVGDLSDPLANAMQFCEKKWQQQWDMVSYCASKQIQGAQDFIDTLGTLPKPEKLEIFSHCSKKWQPQHDMMAYCANNQAAAWRALNQ